MAKYKKGGWQGVSTHFSPIQGPTDYKRQQATATDIAKKAEDQLRTQKTVYAQKTEQDRRTAYRDEKTTEYELRALKDFSSTVGKMFNETVLKQKIKSDRKEIHKALQSWHEKDQQFGRDKLELETLLENNDLVEAKRAELETKLDALVTGRENEILSLSGNEKFAFYARKAHLKLQNVEIDYHNSYTDNADQTIIGHDGVERRVGDITHPADRQIWKNEFMYRQIEGTQDPESDNYMGGLKDKFVTQLYSGPLSAELNRLHKKDIKIYNTEQAQQRIDARDTRVRNSIDGLPGHEQESILKNYVIATARDLQIQGKLNPKAAALDNLKTVLTGHLSTAVDKKDLETKVTNIEKLVNMKLDLPGGRMSLREAFPDRFGEAVINKAWGTALKNKELMQQNFQKRRVLEATAKKREWIKGKIDSGEFSGPNDPRIQQEWVKHWAHERRYNNKILPFITSQMNDVELEYRTDAQWLNKGLEVADRYGTKQIPIQEVDGIPETVIDELETMGYTFTQGGTWGRENQAQKDITSKNIRTINDQLKLLEKRFGGLNSPLSVTVRELASDLYFQKLGDYMRSEEGMTHDRAAAAALADVKKLIVDGTGVKPGENVDNNPLISNHHTDGAWALNPTVNGYPGSLPTDNQRMMQHVINRTGIPAGTTITEPSKTWLWPDINLEDPSTYKHLLTGDDKVPSPLITWLAGKYGIKPSHFLKLQRDAAIKKWPDLLGVSGIQENFALTGNVNQNWMPDKPMTGDFFIKEDEDDLFASNDYKRLLGGDQLIASTSIMPGLFYKANSPQTTWGPTLTTIASNQSVRRRPGVENQAYISKLPLFPTDLPRLLQIARTHRIPVDRSNIFTQIQNNPDLELAFWNIKSQEDIDAAQKAFPTQAFAQLGQLADVWDMDARDLKTQYRTFIA